MITTTCSMESEVYSSCSEDETHAVAAHFASRLEKGDIVTLSGDLGAGKTEFVRGICNYFDVEDIVSSPTFSIINVYTGRFRSGEAVRIVHVDLYRLKSKDELKTIGLEEWLALPDAIKLIEWPEKANGFLSQQHYHVEIRTLPGLEDRRKICISVVNAPCLGHVQK